MFLDVLEDVEETHAEMATYVEDMWNSAQVFLVIWAIKLKCFKCLLHLDT